MPFFTAQTLFSALISFRSLASAFSIAVIHTICNVFMTAVFLPASSLLEKISCKMVKGGKENDKKEILLDERLFINPGVALEQSVEKAREMAIESVVSFRQSFDLIGDYSDEKFHEIKAMEKAIDEYEDRISSYLVKLSAKELTDGDSYELSKLLHVLGGFERISDHAVHIALYARQLDENHYSFTGDAKAELTVIISAVLEAIDMTTKAFCHNDVELAVSVEPLEEVVDRLTSKAKSNHIDRMLKNECTFETGLVFADILAVLERVSDHCSDIAASIVEISRKSMGVHEYLHEFKSKNNPEYIDKYNDFIKKYQF